MPKRKFTRDAVGSSSTQASAKKRRGGSGQPKLPTRRSAATRLQAIFRGRRVRKYGRVTRKRKPSLMFQKYGVKHRWSTKALLSKGRIARNRKRALEILAEKAAAKMIKKKALSVVNKKKLAQLPGVVTRHLYRKYCTMTPNSNTLWMGANGQLMIDPDSTPGKPYIDKISHAPFYHFEGYKNFVEPGVFKRFVAITLGGNEPSAQDLEQLTDYSSNWTNPLAGTGVVSLGIPPHPPTGSSSENGVSQLTTNADMFVYDQGMDPHQNLHRHFGYNENRIEILPKIYHEKQLEEVIEKNRDGYATIDKYIDEWARCLPSRSTDQVKIKNFYIKFDFDTKFYGDEGERTNYIRALHYGAQQVIYRANTPALPTSTTSQQDYDVVQLQDKQGQRGIVSMNNRVPNMFAKVRVIIGKRKVFGKNAGERVALHNVLKTDDNRMYQRGISDEEYLSDLFSRQNIRARKKTYGVTHRTMDEDEYDDITIVKDEVITLGRGHSVKTFNVFKNQVLTYPSTEQNNGMIIDPIPETVSSSSLVTVGQANFDKFGYQNITEQELGSDADVDKLKIPLENDMFMYVLNYTKGAAVKWRLSTKMSYHSC